MIDQISVTFQWNHLIAALKSNLQGVLTGFLEKARNRGREGIRIQVNSDQNITWMRECSASPEAK
jgi:hypothetical protein